MLYKIYHTGAHTHVRQCYVTTIKLQQPYLPIYLTLKKIWLYIDGEHKVISIKNVYLLLYKHITKMKMFFASENVVKICIRKTSKIN